MTTIIGTGEVGALHSREELEEMQRLPLQRKIQITTARIIEWYQHYDGKVYVAFSGGKDSTVLLDIVRRIYPDVPAVFSDTGLEFPEVREFVKSCENVTIVRPEMNFRKVIEVYGYPVTVAHSKTKSLLQATQNRDVVIYATPIITQDISYNTRDLVIDLGNSVPHPDRLNCPYVNRIGQLTVSILLNRFAKKESVWI